jgi:glucose-6-phosphate 1-epimerase
MDECASLNEQFPGNGRLRFAPGPGGLTVAEIHNTAATARIALHGAHVLEFQPRGARPLLWLSGKSWFTPDKPIRGGIPLCWPWFGAHPTDPALPAHGFARVSPWHVLEVRTQDAAVTGIRLGLRDSEVTRRLWEHAFEAIVEVTVGAELSVTLVVRNPGNGPYSVTAALHTYFAVSAVTEARVLGFDGCPYVDTVGGARTPGVQSGPVRVQGETDLIFSACPGEAVIEDPGWGRRIRIRKAGSLSAVVWNPWIAKAKRMPDFGDDEYPGMICVETTNAPGDARTVPSGGEHRLQAILGVEALA